MNGTLAVPKMPRPAASFSAPGPPDLRTKQVPNNHQPTERHREAGIPPHQMPQALRAHIGPRDEPDRPEERRELGRGNGTDPRQVP